MEESEYYEGTHYKKSEYTMKVSRNKSGGINRVFRPILSKEEYEKRFNNFKQACADYMLDYFKTYEKKARKAIQEVEPLIGEDKVSLEHLEAAKQAHKDMIEELHIMTSVEYAKQAIELTDKIKQRLKEKVI